MIYRVFGNNKRVKGGDQKGEVCVIKIGSWIG